MSNPSIVEGIYFTMYPNVILEAINQSNMTKTQIKICNHIIRQTFGWHKSWAIISHEDFVYACATSRQSISRQLPQLIDKNVIKFLNRRPFQASAYKMNENIDTWDPSIFVQGVVVHTTLPNHPHVNPDLHEVVVNTPLSHANSGLHVHVTPALHDEAPSAIGRTRSQQPLNKALNKYKIQRVNIYCEEEVEYKLAKLLYECIVENYPEYELPDIQKWSYIMHKMIQYDGRDPELIRYAIISAAQDSYWMEHILRPEEFRASFDAIINDDLF